MYEQDGSESLGYLSCRKKAKLLKILKTKLTGKKALGQDFYEDVQFEQLTYELLLMPLTLEYFVGHITEAAIEPLKLEQLLGEMLQVDE